MGVVAVGGFLGKTLLDSDRLCDSGGVRVLELNSFTFWCFGGQANDEVTLLTSLAHKNVVKFFGICRHITPSAQTVMLVTEFCEGGSLQECVLCLRLRAALPRSNPAFR